MAPHTSRRARPTGDHGSAERRSPRRRWFLRRLRRRLQRVDPHAPPSRRRSFRACFQCAQVQHRSAWQRWRPRVTRCSQNAAAPREHQAGKPDYSRPPSARSASRRDPAWLTTPRSSAAMTSLGRDPEVCTLEVPSCWGDRSPRQASSSPQKAPLLLPFEFRSQRQVKRGLRERLSRQGCLAVFWAVGRAGTAEASDAIRDLWGG